MIPIENQLISFLTLIIMLLISNVSVENEIKQSNKKQNSISIPMHRDDSFRDDFNGNSINTSEWQIANWIEHDGQTSYDRCYAKDGFLNLVFVNSSTRGFQSAAIQTRRKFLYGRWEARIKPTSAKGILNSMYTIDMDNTRQEIDIEFLTNSFIKNFGRVHFAVHERGNTSFNTNPDIKLNFNPSDDFHVWAFEISPESIRWFVDGKMLHTYNYKNNAIKIDEPYQLKFNIWSQNGGWVGGPPDKDVECLYQIDWIRFIPYKIK